MTTLNSVPSGLLSTVDATGTLNIQTNSVNALAIDTNQNATMNYVSAQNTFGFKNRIINGAMVISQRGTSFTPALYDYTLDRYQTQVTQSSKFTIAQSTTAPAGFGFSMLATSSSAYSITSTDCFAEKQYIEGFNFYDCAWGTASAKTVTLSFWVQSSLTGTFGGALQNAAGNRSYPYSYTISSANTWTQVSVTIPGDTTGTWVGATNGVGCVVIFSLGMGSTLSNTAGSWAAGDYRSVTGATSVVGTNGATFYITGVQLEKGSIATPFDYRDYGRELALCQRYCWVTSRLIVSVIALGQCYSTNGASYLLNNPVPMRTAPSVSFNNQAYFNMSNSVNSGVGHSTSISLGTANENTVRVDATCSLSNLTAGSVSQLFNADGSANNGIITISAEL